MGRNLLIGTDKEKKLIAVRLPVIEVEEVKKANYYGFNDLSKFMLSLWKAGLKKNRKLLKDKDWEY